MQKSGPTEQKTNNRLTLKQVWHDQWNFRLLSDFCNEIFWSIFNHFLRRQSFVNLTGNLWGLMLSCIFVVLTNVVLLKTSSCWMGFSHLNSQNSLETCQIAFSPTSEQNRSQNWSYKFLCHRIFPVFGLSSVCQLWHDSISWYVHLIFEEFCWVSKVCFGDALFCLMNGVSPLLNNQLDLLLLEKIERSGWETKQTTSIANLVQWERSLQKKPQCL